MLKKPLLKTANLMYKQNAVEDFKTKISILTEHFLKEKWSQDILHYK